MNEVRVTCKLCNEEFRSLWGHLKRVHNVDIFGYRRMFPDAPTTAVEEQLHRGPRSEETKRRIEDANRGYMHTEEAKRVMSIAHTGMKLGEEAKRKLSEANKGRVFDEEFCRRVSEGRKGHITSDETRQKISIALIGRKHSNEERQQISNSLMGHKGHKFTKEELQRMSESAKENWKDPEYARRVSEAQCRRPNEPELQLQSILDKHFPNDWKYVGDGSFWIEGKNPDFVNVNSKKQVIEVFGIYWHNEDEVAPRITHFKKYGFDCIIFWEFDVYNEEEVVATVAAMNEDKVKGSLEGGN